MAKAIIEKLECISCGADVRDGTQFCYACGKPVAHETVVNSEIDAGDLSTDSTAVAETIEIKTERTERLATAAAERRKLRTRQRKPKQLVWEEPGESSNRVFVLVCLLIFLFAALIVFFTVFNK